MVVEDFQQPDVKLDYFGGTSGTYAGFDAFDRVVDQQWYDYGASAVRDRYTYGYDRASNRLYRENVGPSAKDEHYGYDGMYQLTVFKRGDLNEDETDISGTPLREEDFTLDPTGNWAGYLQKISGSTQLNQSRTHNPVNEVTDITETVGPAWATPAHDLAGNMTTVPDPLGLTAGLTCKYDAWNRLVEVKDGTEVVAQYEYDGLNRRVLKRVPVTGQGSASGGGEEYETDYYFHNAGWQVLETRRTDQSSASPDNLQPKYQYVWSARYIDAPILRDKNTDTDWLCDDERLYYLTDANFNVTTLVTIYGDAIERYLYDPYGKVTIYDGTWTNTRSSSSYDNTILYTGREYDPETGFYHYRMRPLHVELGRFASRDPSRLRGGVNRYAYVANRPVRAVDPTGRARVDYVANRGTFTDVVVMSPDAAPPGTLERPLTPGAVRMAFQADWTPFAERFKKPDGCCRCSRVGWAQIYTVDTDYRGLFGGASEIGTKRSWGVDTAIPYPGGKRACLVPRIHATIRA